jgi:hypothetical protein
VRLDELFEENGAWFFTMELVQGTDWLSYVRRADGLPRAESESRIRATLVQIVEALAALHATGTVHRDVKPTNVLVSRAGHVKLLDFGIATRARRAADASDEGIVGTLAYMPPEQLLSEEPTPASDFYAVGVMLHEALTGALPFADRPGDGINAKLSSAPTPVATIAPDAPQDLANLTDALLRSAAGDRPDATAILRVLGSTDSGTSGEFAAVSEDFVGRSDELELLHEAANAAFAGAAVTVVVEGASGVGKSALVRHFLHGLRERALVLEGRCHEREYVPYKGLDAIVDELAGHLANESEDALDALSKPAVRLLPRLFPVLTRVPFFATLVEGSFGMAEGDAGELRARIFGAFRELIARVAERRLLVLAIDDIQWADGDTLALLSEVLAPPSPPPILVVCTRRISEDESAGRASVPVLPLPGDVRRVSLGGLSASEVSELASHLSRAAHLGPRDLAAIAAESGGHPLFLQELVRRRQHGKDATDHLRLDDALWSRVVQLGEPERRIVEAVAVAGLPTALDLIVLATGVPRRDIPRHMATLRTANLVKVGGTNTARRIEPYHDRVREAVVSHLDAGARREWHERLARSLEASPERDVERLAMHWEGAGDAPRAVDLYREAAERASNALAFDRAVDFYRRSLDLLDASSDRRPLERALADALFNAGHGGEAGRAYLALAGAGTDRPNLELRSRAASTFLSSGHFSAGVDVLRSVLESVGLPFPVGRFAVVIRILWYRFLLRLRGLALAPRNAANSDPMATMRVDMCWTAAYGFGMTEAMTGQVFHALGSRLALQLGDPFRAVRALCGYAIAVSTGGLKSRAQTAEVIRTIRKLGAPLRDPYTEAFADGAEGFASYMLDDWTKAEVHFTTGEARFRDQCVGANYELGTMRMMIGRTLAQLGRLTELEERVGPILRDALRRNDLYNMINTRATVSTLLALARDDVAGADVEVSEARRALSARGFQVQHFYWLVAAGMVDIYRGDPEAALARLEENRAAMRASLLERVESMKVVMVHLRARAHLAIAAKDPARRDAHLALATKYARELERAGVPAAIALGKLVHAATLAIGGDRAGAIAGLRDTIERFDATKMALHAAAARSALAALVGGTEAAALSAHADARFREQHVANPARFVHLYAPGFVA